MDVADNISVISRKNTVELLFHYLMSLEVPPNEVHIYQNSIHLYWYPTGKMAVKTKGEYIDLLIQFQKYIDSINLLDLTIEFIEISNYKDKKEESESDKLLPVEFSKENFSYYNGEEIVFMELIEGGREQYWLMYDSMGKVITSDGEELE